MTETITDLVQIANELSHHRDAQRVKRETEFTEMVRKAEITHRYGPPYIFGVSHGELWMGRTGSDENLHWAQFSGFYPDMAPIWILRRTEPPEDLRPCDTVPLSITAQLGSLLSKVTLEQSPAQPLQDASLLASQRIWQSLQLGFCPSCKTLMPATAILRTDPRITQAMSPTSPIPGLTCPVCKFAVPYNIINEVERRLTATTESDMAAFSELRRHLETPV